MYKRFMILFAVGCAVWQLKKRHRRDQDARDAEGTPAGVKPEQVTDWEGEGGALHGSGPQLGPEPALP
jgi:hypothetical protein